MASKKYLVGLNLQAVGTLDTVPAGFVGFNAKADGLYQRISGADELRLLTTADAAGYVPYTGATANVNLGVHNLTVDTNTLFVDSVNHRVGIGTTAPGTKLVVAGASPIFRIENSTTKADALASSILFYNTSGVADVEAGIKSIYRGGAADANKDLDFYTGGNVITPKVTIEGTSGNVGIGTTAPHDKLDVWGNIRLGQTNSTLNRGILSYTDSGTLVSSITRNDSIAGVQADLAISAYNGIGFNISSGAALPTSYSMYIAPSGYVGIGTLIPSNLLTVQGHNDILKLTNGSAYMKMNAYDSAYGNNMTIKGYSGSGMSIVSLYTNTNLSLLTLGTGNVLVPNGYLGIGTANPSSALDVAGLTTSQTLKLTTGAASGYLLTSDASGNASWAAYVATSITATDITNWNTAFSAAHYPLSLGTAQNGLSLAANQVLSLTTASAERTGALTATDWNTFNSKDTYISWDIILDSSTTVRHIMKTGATGLAAGEYSSLNLIAGTGITLSESSGSGGKYNVTIAASGGGSSHDPVTIGASANGLSLGVGTQVLSLGLASSEATGALSAANWSTFNNKVSFPGFGTDHVTAAYGDHTHAGIGTVTPLADWYTTDTQTGTGPLYQFLYTMPSGTLATNGDKLELVYCGTINESVNIILSLDTSTSRNGISLGAATGNFVLHINYTRASSTSIAYSIVGNIGSTSISAFGIYSSTVNLAAAMYTGMKLTYSTSRNFVGVRGHVIKTNAA